MTFFFLFCLSIGIAFFSKELVRCGAIGTLLYAVIGTFFGAALNDAYAAFIFLGLALLLSLALVWLPIGLVALLRVRKRPSPTRCTWKNSHE
jgi:hypothetical protein